MTIKKWIPGQIFALGVLATFSANAFPQGTLCHADEKIFFSCEVGRKVVSLCAGSQGASYLEYRYGTRNNVELTHKATAEEKSKFKRTEVLYSSNSSKIIWFRVERYEYILNFPLRGEPTLEVRNKEKTVAEMTCKGGWKGVSGNPEGASEFITDLPETSAGDLDKVLMR